MSSAPTAARRKSSWSTPLLFLSFALVFLILFNNDLRIATGLWVGYALDPVIGFGGRYPVITIFLASVVLVLATTTIRHFLVDWTMMARTQEAMRSFQKEFSEARKANNTYKIKKLTEAQPKVFELQADLQKDQLKPMAFTMIIVIPLFAWLGTFLAAPVGFTVVEGPDEPVVVVLTHGPGVSGVVAADDSVRGMWAFSTDRDLYGYALLPPGVTGVEGDVVLRGNATGATFPIHTAPAPQIPEEAKILDLAAGTYALQLAAPAEGRKLTLTGEFGPHDVASVALVAILEDGSVRTDVVRAGAATTLALPQAAAVYAIVPDGLPGGEATGEAVLQVTDGETREVPITPANVVEIDREIAAPVYPYSAELPWQDPWSLQDLWWFLPHWILIYSLFGIPFGQITQRALKLWEYRHVDLDGDGRKAGEA